MTRYKSTQKWRLERPPPSRPIQVATVPTSLLANNATALPPLPLFMLAEAPPLPQAYHLPPTCLLNTFSSFSSLFSVFFFLFIGRNRWNRKICCQTLFDDLMVRIDGSIVQLLLQVHLLLIIIFKSLSSFFFIFLSVKNPFENLLDDKLEKSEEISRKNGKYL